MNKSFLENDSRRPPLLSKQAGEESERVLKSNKSENNLKYTENDKLIKSNTSPMNSNKNHVCLSAYTKENGHDSLPSCFTTDKTREQILIERKIRKKEQKIQKKLLSLEEQRIKNLESCKSKKISIIDKITMDGMLNDCNKSKTMSYFNINNSNKNIIKQPKRNDLIEFDLSTIGKIDKHKSKPHVKFAASTKPNSCNTLDANKPLMHKGKKYENKTKPLTKLKKNILRYRNEKNPLPNYINETANDSNVDNNDITSQIVTHFQEILIGEDSDLKSEDLENGDIKSDHTENALLYRELKTSLQKLIVALFNFQDRAYKANPVRANMRKRYVVGFHEVVKSIKLKNVFLVIVASDIEKKGCEGVVNEIQSITTESDIPLIFALKRREIGYLTHKRVSVSCIAILNKEGAEEIFNNCLDCHKRIVQQKSVL